MADRKDAKDFTPSIYSEGPHQPTYGVMLVELTRCASCARPMPRGKPDRSSRLFPAYWEATFEKQIGRAGWSTYSGQSIDGKGICEVCADEGKASFTCALCKQTRNSKESHESFGDPAEHVCEPCYEKTPAKQWDDAIKKLEEEHRHDFD